MSGWDVRITRRSESDVTVLGPEPAPVSGFVHPVLHAATIAMPPQIGDYGSQVVPLLGLSDVFIAMVEFNPADGESTMFRDGFPKLRASEFDPAISQRVLPSRSGTQRFFSVSERAFGLFCVIGSHIRRTTLVPKLNQFLAQIEVEPK